MKPSPHFVFFAVLAALTPTHAAQPVVQEVTSLAELAAAAAGNNRHIKVRPGVYRMTEYLTPEVLRQIADGVDRSHRRPPVPMFVFRGSGNRFDLRDVTLEIDTALYALLPSGGYTRCVIVAGSDNYFDGLTIRNVGANQGSNGNILSVAGEGNTLENVSLHVHGSFPYGYGDLLGKGGPNLVPLQKQSGVQVLGSRTTLRYCKVISRAFGHCFYIQGGDEVLIDSCYAEGAVRSTNDMLRETSGTVFDLGFKSVYENRDGRYFLVPGYMKSLVEDGFRTYGGAGDVTLRNCTAVNTRAGFEIGARDDAPRKSLIENCAALGCERGYLLGSNVVVRHSRGNISHGPLLYLRGGRGSDVELELADIGDQTVGTVHALATIAGSNHRVRLTGREQVVDSPRVPIMVGFGMPAHGEMASPIRPAPTSDIHLINELKSFPVITYPDARAVKIDSASRVWDDAELTKSPGDWGG